MEKGARTVGAGPRARPKRATPGVLPVYGCGQIYPAPAGLGVRNRGLSFTYLLQGDLIYILAQPKSPFLPQPI